MKTLHHLLITLMLSVGVTAVKAQSITCDFFTVVGMEPDTFDLNNTLINIQMAGDFSAFANYPYIASVTDCTGDTVFSGGNLVFFGQIGGTIQGYPVSALDENVCLPLSIEFVYGNDNFETDTCQLTYDGTILCDLFSVTGIEADPFNPENSLINIQMDGNTDDLVSYPFIPVVRDCMGDTIATGSMFFFGQLGQTEQGYPVSLLSSDICFPITVEFFYGSVDETFPAGTTCLLTYDGQGLSMTDFDSHTLGAFPNPTQGEIQLSCSESLAGKSFSVFNSTGILACSGRISEAQARIDLSALPEGVYMVIVESTTARVVKTK